MIHLVNTAFEGNDLIDGANIKCLLNAQDIIVFSYFENHYDHCKQYFLQVSIAYLPSWIFREFYFPIEWFQDNVVESEVSIDPKHHRHFVSRRAQVLRDIADEFGGVAVSFPRDANSTRVTVKGKVYLYTLS